MSAVPRTFSYGRTSQTAFTQELDGQQAHVEALDRLDAEGVDQLLPAAS